MSKTIQLFEVELAVRLGEELVHGVLWDQRARRNKPECNNYIIIILNIINISLKTVVSRQV